MTRHYPHGEFAADAAGDLNALTRALTGDHEAAAAYAAGRAVAQGWENLPVPSDSVYETLIDGVPVRVLMVEPGYDAG